MLIASEEQCGEQKAKGSFNILQGGGLPPVAEFAIMIIKTCFFFLLDTQQNDTFQTPLQSDETITKCDTWAVDKNDLCSSIRGPRDPQAALHSPSLPWLRGEHAKRTRGQWSCKMEGK